MLTLTNLHATVADKPILNGLTLTIPAGEVHALMGPNGAGKSTLGHAIAGKPGVTITDGSMTYQGQNLLDLAPHERAQQGIFLAFQYPVSLPGVNAAQFIRTCLNAGRTARGEKELNAAEFLKLANAKLAELKMDASFLKRAVNDGFSGGEKKRFEMLQMLILEPSLIIMDETDSGLDVDALKLVSQTVHNLRDAKRSFLVITHYTQLVQAIQPDQVHILAQGKIHQSGGLELADKVDSEGFAGIAA